MVSDVKHDCSNVVSLQMCPLSDVSQNNLNGDVSQHSFARERSRGRCDMELIDAVKRNDARQTQHYLSSGCDVNNSCDLADRTPLFCAALNGNRKICGLCVAFGADVNKVTGNGCTALHGAAQRGSVEVTDLLVKRRVRIDHQSDDGDTALHIAAHHGHVPLVNYLLRHADVTIQNKRSMTALDVAKSRGHREVADILSRQRVHLPLTRTRPLATNNDSKSPEVKVLNTSLNVLHEDLSRSRSAPNSVTGLNNIPPPTLENARSHINLAPCRSGSELAAHECCACAHNLRHENRALRTENEEMQLKLALALDEIEQLKQLKHL